MEVGSASGKEPTESIQIQSYVGQFLQETGVTLGADDEGSFKMRLLHFRRTFVEKMFAIHGKVDTFQKTDLGIGSYARHYYDLFCLAERPEVLAMLGSEEYEMIKSDYDRISRKTFEKSYVPPPNMSFEQSVALFPPPELGAVLATEFEKQCRLLCFGDFPTWENLQARLNSIRNLL